MEMLSSWWGGGSAQPTAEEQNESKSDGATAAANEKPAEPDVDVVVVQESSEKSESPQIQKTDENTPETDAIDADAAIAAAKEWGSYLYNFAKEGTKKVAEQAIKTASDIQKTVEEKTIVGDFNKEQQKFVKEKHSKRSDAAVPPWVGYNEEETMKEQIMALSQDKRNFLRNPPAGVQFHFEFEHMFPIAMATLQEDDRLQKMRFDLVPKQISEENFWRNYFYRVSLIKQSSQLTSLANASGEQSSKTDSNGKKTTEELDTDSRKDKSTPVSIPPSSQSASKTSESEDLTDMPPDSPPGTEFASDAFSSELDQDDLKKGMEQLGMDKKQSQDGAAPQVGWFVIALLQTLCFLAPLFGHSKRPSPSSDKKVFPPQPSSKPSVSNGGPEEVIPDWEKELQQELQDYEVVDEGAGENEEWEKEIDQMLEDEIEENTKLME